MLTAKQVVQCRRFLAEHKAKQEMSDRRAQSSRATIQRVWTGVPETLQGPALEFLSTYISAANLDVVRVTGDPSIPGVLGDYLFNHEIANGQPVRTNGTYFLKAVHYEAASNQWQWAIVDNNNMILFLTALTDDYIAHWADDEDEWKDEWAFEDGQGVLEPATALPEVPDFVGQSLSMTAAEDHLMVNEYGWVVTDEEATYTVTGSIALETVVADGVLYGEVKAPMVESKIRSGTWRGGMSSVVRDVRGDYGPRGEWIVTQELTAFDSLEYLLIGYRTPGFYKREIRLYQDIPEADVPGLVNELSTHAEYIVEEDVARKTNRRVSTEMFDLYLVLLHVPPAEVRYEETFDTSEGDWGASAWKFVTDHTKIVDSSGDLVGYDSYRRALVTGHSEVALVRKVTVMNTKTYFKDEPAAPVTGAVATGGDKLATFDIVGGKKYHLPNGLWITESIAISKDAWGVSA